MDLLNQRGRSDMDAQPATLGIVSDVNGGSLSLPSHQEKADGRASVSSNSAILECLADTFCSDGFIFERIRRQGDFGIYRKYKCESFEVIRVRRLKAHSFKGKEYPTTEVYPRSEEWGQNGFTYRTLAEANRKFTSLIKESEVR